MAIFSDGRVVVLYSNGHRDETRLVQDTIELEEYDNLKTTLRLLDDGALRQTNRLAMGLAKIWKRIAKNLNAAPEPLTASSRPTRTIRGDGQQPGTV